MEVLSKVKKVEDSNFFNQHLSNVMIEDVSEVLSTVVKKEDGDFFNQHLSSAYIEDVDLDASFGTISKEEDSDTYNQSLSSAYIEDVDLDVSFGTIFKEEDSDTYNQSLSSAYIEDVDLDASFGTITKVEQFDYNSFIDSKLSEFEELFESENNKYYKIVITKEKQSGGSTLANGSFEWIKYAGRRTLNYTSNMTTEDIYFEDINGNEIECTCSYLSGRWGDNYSSRDYAPSNFFVTNAEESWVSDKSSTVYSEIISSSGSELKYQILFKTKIPLEYINGLVFDNGRDSGRNVSVVVYSSDDLETFTELMNEDLPSGNTYTFSLENAQTWDGYKIVLTATEPANGETAHLSTASFENLEYDTCLSFRSATATSETIVFTDGENYYNCRISVSSRWSDNGHDDYAPHNFFAPAGKRVSYEQTINATTSEILVCTLKFADDISLDLIDNLTLYAGWNLPRYNSGYIEKVKYELYDNDNTLLYEETKTNETNSGDYAMTFSHGLSSSSSNSSNVSD